MTKFNRNLRLIYSFMGTLLLAFGQTEVVGNPAIAHPTASSMVTPISDQNQQPEIELTDNSCSSTLNEKQALEIALLSENAAEENLCQTDVVSKDTICPTSLTIPSLWWADEQFGDKLLENWLAYPEEKRVDLVVNRQIWGLMDYYQRYAFVHRMVTVVQETGETGDIGYNLRVFNRQEPELCLAAYTCNADNCQLKITDFGPRSNISR
jgi:hypothetical protein